MSEALGSHERNLPAYSEHIGLQGRLLAGPRALNHSVVVENLDPTRLQQPSAQVIDRALIADRRGRWEGSGTESHPDQLERWKNSFVSSFTRKKDSGYFETPQGIRAAAFYGALGIDASAMTADAAQVFYDRFLNGVSVNEFIEAVSLHYHGKDYAEMQQDLPVIQELAVVFGKEHGAETVANLVDLKKRLEGTGRDAFVRMANQTATADGEEMSRMNRLTDREKELLSFLNSHAEDDVRGDGSSSSVSNPDDSRTRPPRRGKDPEPSSADDPVKPSGSGPHPTEPAGSSDKVISEEEKRRKYLKEIIKAVEKHPSYGKKKLAFIDKDGKKTDLDKIGNLLQPDPDGTKFIIEVIDVGSDTFYEVYDLVKLRKIVDEEGNVLFEKGEEVKETEAYKAIFEKAGKRTIDEAAALADEVARIQIEQATKGLGKMEPTIQDMRKKQEDSGRKEVVADGLVTYLPDGEGKIIVVGDIHGDFATVEQVIAKSQFLENMEFGDKSARIVFLGDVIDRGKKDVEVLEALMEMKRRYPENVILMKADHEVVSGVDPHDYPQRMFYHYYEKYPGDITKDLPDAVTRTRNHAGAKNLLNQGKVSEADIRDYLLLRLRAEAPADTAQRITDLKNRLGSSDWNTFLGGINDGEWPILENNPLMKDHLAKMFDVLPRMAVCGNGVVLVHGGPNGRDFNLQQLSAIRDRHQVDAAFDDSMVWADVLPEANFQRIQSGSDVDEQIAEMERQLSSDPSLAQVTDQHGTVWAKENVALARKRVELARKMGVWFNTGRGLGGELDAVWSNKYVFSDQGVRTFLDLFGGSVMLRGHQVTSEIEGGKANPLRENIFLTLHTTGKGSSDSHYKSREYNPNFAVFNASEQIKQIDAARHIIPVW